MNIKIIDNFLTKDDFEKISSIEFNKIRADEMRVYHNTIDNDENIKAECFDPTFLKRMNENYHIKALSLLRELSPLKVDLYDYSDFNIIETGANYEFPIHDDTPNKLLSGVIYLKPEKNYGTMFYKNKKGEAERLIEWKVNRAVFFSRSERETWNSFKGDRKSNRIVLVYNLMTKRVKQVYKLEKKNYILSQIRNKINPFLYKFFNFTI
jgi:hypothetical protein